MRSEDVAKAVSEIDADLAKIGTEKASVSIGAELHKELSSAGVITNGTLIEKETGKIPLEGPIYKDKWYAPIDLDLEPGAYTVLRHS